MFEHRTRSGTSGHRERRRIAGCRDRIKDPPTRVANSGTGEPASIVCGVEAIRMETAMSRPLSACKTILSRRGAPAPGHRHLSPPFEAKGVYSTKQSSANVSKNFRRGAHQRLEEPFATREVGRSKSGSCVRPRPQCRLLNI